jgi:hypothetical protein
MFSLRSKLIGAAAGFAMAAGFAANADAGPVAFDFNVAGASFSGGGSSGSTLADINQLGFAQTTLTQIFLNTQTGRFDDTGSLTLDTFTSNSTNITHTFIDNTADLTIQYSLTGQDTAGGLTFDNGGSVTLFQGLTKIATFSIVQPSTSTNGVITNNGVVGTLSLGLTLKQNDTPSLITLPNTGPGGPSLINLSLDFVTAQPQFNGANGSITPGVDCPADLPSTPATTTGCTEFITSALSGTIQIDSLPVPEPAILGLFGFSLLGLAGLRARRKVA